MDPANPKDSIVVEQQVRDVPTDDCSVLDIEKALDLKTEQTHTQELHVGILEAQTAIPIPESSANSQNTKTIIQEDEKTDPDLVTWDGPDDPENPKNWNIRTKFMVTTLEALFGLITLISGPMLAPALPRISTDLHIKSPEETQLVLSIFLLAYCFGPLVIAPLSEVYGRRPVLMISNIFFIIWNTVSGFSYNKSTMIAAHFLGGLGASAPLAIGGGMLGDIWYAEERGRAINIYSLIPLCGPAIGPILGGIITGATTWRWLFWAISILCLLLQVYAFFCFRECYAPVLLKRKAAAERKRTGNEKLHTEWEIRDQGILYRLSHALRRPFLILTTHPVVQINCLTGVVAFGSLYVIISYFSHLWMTVYHQTTLISSLHYISLGLGLVLGAQAGGRLIDRLYKRLKRTRPESPELRVPVMIPGAIFSAVGLIWYGWSAQARLFWIMPDIGVMLFGVGSQMTGQSQTAYLVDTYGIRASSAISASLLPRTLAGFAFPLFTPKLYQNLGYGWGDTMLAFMVIGVSLTTGSSLWFFGPRLRKIGLGHIGQ